uniref:Arabidopsis retrotransposon Orf1 C-terminal domain-containing protein n=1 Tax=Noccaea caerulescens TaxID=107243 RepID=A0A1J3DUH4_NOCCA
MLNKVEKMLGKARKKKQEQPTTAEVHKRETRAMTKSKREEIAQGKRQLEEDEVESESEQDNEPMEEQHDQAEEYDQEAEHDNGSEQEEEDQEDDDTEIEEVQPVRRRTRGTGGTQSTRSPPLRPDPNQLLRILKSMEFTGTRYPHPDTMHELGIKRDVDYLLEMCDLAMMTSQRCEAYKEETCQFLSSFVLHLYENEPEVESDGGLGYITFTVNGEQYGLTTNQLDTLYGFLSGQGRKRKFDKKEVSLENYWRQEGVYF